MDVLFSGHLYLFNNLFDNKYNKIIIQLQERNIRMTQP